jgi:hypothetical protein
MNPKLTLSAVILATSLLLTQSAVAAEDVSCYAVLKQDPDVLSKDSGEGPAWSPEAIKKLRQDRAECRQRAVVARERLQAEFNIDPGNMTDSMAISRLDEELERRRAAEQADEFRRRDEANKRQEAAADDWAEKGSSMMEQQNEMLRGMGVDPKSIPGLDEDDEEYEDDDYGSDDSDVDAMELQMYERMIAEGVAPACKGQKDQDLIDCVDEVLDAEE